MMELQLRNIITKLCVGAIILLVCFFILITSKERRGFEASISIEAEKGYEFKYPIIIKEEEKASGGKILETNHKDLQHHALDGYSKYKINIPADGMYYFYGLCYWPHVCANSFFIQVNQDKPIPIGQDPITKRWHWISSKFTQLNKGENYITLYSGENLAKIDKFILSTDPLLQGRLENITPSYFIDFDSNIENSLELPKKTNSRIDSINGNRVLNIKPLDEGLFEKYLTKGIYKDKFVIKCSVKESDNKQDDEDLVLIYNYKNKRNYNYIAVEKRQFEIGLVKRGQGKVINKLKNSEEFTSTNFSWLELIIDSTDLTLYFNDKLITKTKIPENCKGKLGVGSKKGGIYVDNLAFIGDLDAKYKKTFHGTEFYRSRFQPDTLPNYLQAIKNHELFWKVISGWWSNSNYGNFFAYAPVFSHGINIVDGLDALLIGGHCYWKNYSIGMAVSVAVDEDIGLLYNYQDADNYYFVKLSHSKQWLYEANLYKVVNREKILLSKNNSIQSSGFWNKLEIKQLNGIVNIYFGNQLILMADDSEFKNGKVGLWSNSKRGKFADIHISPTTSLNVDSLDAFYEYSFDWAKQLATDYTRWLWYPERHFKGTFLTKKGNEEIMVTHKSPISSNFSFRIIQDANYHIPDSLNLDFYFHPTEDSNSTYRFIVESKKVLLLKNNVKVIENFYDQARGTLDVVHKDNIWELRNTITEMDTPVIVLRYVDDCELKNINFGFGISGYGDCNIGFLKAQISVNK